jgi:hypothetical protein
MKSNRGAREFCAWDLDRLEKELDLWRRQKLGRRRLPEEMWQAAVELARGQGVSYVCRRLRLSYVELRRRVNQRAEGTELGREKVSFVEVPLQNDVGLVTGYRAELSEGERGKLTFYLGGDLPAVLALAESFWGREK